MCAAHLLTSLALVNVILFKREALSIHVDKSGQTEPFSWFRLRLHVSITSQDFGSRLFLYTVCYRALTFPNLRRHCNCLLP
jgi:hypothetical protein